MFQQIVLYSSSVWETKEEIKDFVEALSLNSINNGLPLNPAPLPSPPLPMLSAQ
jgi:hypothetical protein